MIRNNARESLYDMGIIALWPMMFGYAVTMVAMLVAYARP